MEIINRYNLRFLLKHFLTVVVVFATFLLLRSGAYAISFSAAINTHDADTQVKLQWGIDPRAHYYRILRNNGGPDVEVLSIDTDSEYVYNTYTDTGLIPSTLYHYSIHAYRDAAMTVEITTNTADVATSNIIKPYNISSKYDVNSKEVTLTWTGSHAAAGSIVDDGNGYTHPSIGNTATFVENSMSPVSYTISSTDAASHNSGPSIQVTVTPIPPPEISAVAQNSSTSISWGTYERINDFCLEYSLWDGSSWIGWDLALNSLFTGTGTTYYPTVGGSYRYRLTAKSASNYSGSSNISDTVVIPKAPTSLTGTINNKNSITLNWMNDTGNRSDLWVLRQTAVNTYTFLTKLPYTATFFTESISVVSGTTYVYSVEAVEESGASARTCSVTASIPVAPTGLTLTVTSASAITLNWNDTNSAETGYVIERAVDSDGFIQIGTPTAANVVSYGDTGLSTGHVYRYRVKTVNNLGSSPYSNEVYINMSLFVAPNSLKASTVQSSQINLEWTYPGSGSYRTIIERKTGLLGVWSQINITASGVLRYNDIGLSANTQYFYRVKNNIGTGITTDSYPLGNSGIEATTMLGGLTLSGTAASGNTIYLSWWGNYAGGDVIVERKMANGGFAVLTTLNSSTIGWYDNSGLVPGALYTYRIKAKNSSNESVYSNEVSVSNTYLNAPSRLTASANSTSGIDLAWYDNSTDETGFEIWRKIYGASIYTLYATVDRNVVKFTDAAAKTGVQYNYMVRAYISDSEVYSVYSNTVSVGTGLIGAPSNLKYSYLSSSQAILSWTDTASNENGFKVEWKISDEGDWTVLSWLSSNTTSYTVSGLNQYSIYYFRIRAYSYSGNMDSLSSELQVTTALPYPPSNITAVAVSSSRVNIKWKDNSENESGFTIMRKTTALNYYIYVGEVGANVTSYSDNNLYSGVTYVYKVIALGGIGNSESGEVSVTTGKKVTFSDLGSVAWAKESIENLAGRGIVKGKSGKRFMPGDTITKAEFVGMMVRAFKLETTPVGSFADVKVGKWYYKEVMTAEYFGIISGDDNNRFYPDKPITRQEIALIIFKTLEVIGKPLNGHDNSVLEKFRDKDLISPYALSSMASLVGEGIMSGISANAIAPQNSATRAEAAVLIYKVIDR